MFSPAIIRGRGLCHVRPRAPPRHGHALAALGASIPAPGLDSDLNTRDPNPLFQPEASPDARLSTPLTNFSDTLFLNPPNAEKKRRTRQQPAAMPASTTPSVPHRGHAATELTHPSELGGGRSHPTVATAHLCGPPVPCLSGLSYRPCGEARRAQLSAWSWMRKQRLQGSAWFPGGTARRWLGWNASPVSDVRSQQWSVLRGSSKQIHSEGPASKQQPADS
uniref:Uncharacterized protein n=1 Tax=Myotis myotis TaxID=51298 RepID=A0A7J7TIE9_MYOMY|nr:hypothetical protein mMyoMyo1_009035 [Myotis myotis]